MQTNIYSERRSNPRLNYYAKSLAKYLVRFAHPFRECQTVEWAHLTLLRLSFENDPLRTKRGYIKISLPNPT
jgi:hypothetical protein